MAQIRVVMIACARAGLITILIMLTGTFVLADLLHAGSASFPQGENAVASKRTKNLVVTITGPDGRLKGGENSFCVVFQKRETGEPVDVQNASVEFTLLVGRIEEKPIRAQLTEEHTGRYCGHVNLGKQYYVPASYYAFVLYTDAVGKKRKTRLFVSIIRRLDIRLKLVQRCQNAVSAHDSRPPEGMGTCGALEVWKMLHNDLRSVRVCVYIDDRLIRSVQPDCARTVHEWNVFNPFGLALSEKQIPRFVGNVVS
jgi:hypothetical protein